MSSVDDSLSCDPSIRRVDSDLPMMIDDVTLKSFVFLVDLVFSTHVESVESSISYLEGLFDSNYSHCYAMMRSLCHCDVRFFVIDVSYDLPVLRFWLAHVLDVIQRHDWFVRLTCSMLMQLMVPML